MSFLDRVRACARYDPCDYRPFVVEGETVGFVAPEFCALLAAFPSVFQRTSERLELSSALVTAAERTAAVDQVLRQLRARGLFGGWRDEPYPVLSGRSESALLTVERAAVPQFGLVASGVHVNGFVRSEAGLKMWVGRRSLTKPTAPGKLDQIVAGGRPAGYTVQETLIKEAAEEASIPEGLIRTARAVGTITYATRQPEGLRRDVLFLYDLELPLDFAPVNADDEIASFELWPIAQLIETVRDTDAFKFNCALVVIDFLMRHGYLDPDGADYVALAEGLRSLPVATARLMHASMAP
ncbi:MAG: DUF4743 domain-containing protein [Defluviicoccus sp.]